MQVSLVAGGGTVEVDLPEDAVIVEQGLDLPIDPVPDLGEAVRGALRTP